MKEPDRNIFLCSMIDDEVSKDIISKIYQINDYDDEQEQHVENYIRKPIKLMIDSEGGYCDNAFSIISTMLYSKTCIYTSIIGIAASMALIVAICGKLGHRSMSQFARICIHGVSTDIEGKIPYIKSRERGLNIIQDNIKTLFIEYTEVPEYMIDDIFENSKDLFLTPDEALNYGIVDEIDMMIIDSA